MRVSVLACVVAGRTWLWRHTHFEQRAIHSFPYSSLTFTATAAAETLSLTLLGTQFFAYKQKQQQQQQQVKNLNQVQSQLSNQRRYHSPTDSRLNQCLYCSRTSLSLLTLSHCFHPAVTGETKSATTIKSGTILSRQQHSQPTTFVVGVICIIDQQHLEGCHFQSASIFIITLVKIRITPKASVSAKLSSPLYTKTKLA